MAISTVAIQATYDWGQPFLPENLNVGGVGNQPVLGSVNMVLQQFLSPPFRWPWNRATLTFTLVAGQTDYTVTPPSAFGFIERASVTQALQNPPLRTMEIPQLELIFLPPTEGGRPQAIAPVSELANGDIVFRLSPAPGNLWNGETVTVVYQVAPPLITSISSGGVETTWAPLPDKYNYVYQLGFLYYMMMYSRDPEDRQLALALRGDFLASLLAVSEGLSETEKDSFIDTWIRRSAQQTAGGIKPVQGGQARGR